MSLFKHQVEGIAFLKEKGRAILADEMGLGKTRQAICAAIETEGGIPALVVCPASLKINWKREIAHVAPDHGVQIVAPDSYLMPGRQWYIINYDILDKKLEEILELIENEKVGTLILDEAHYIKGKSIRAACIVGGGAKKKVNGEEHRVKFEGIAKRIERVYCLTGTMILNRPIEMFNILKAIGHELGTNRTVFARRYCGAYLKTIMRKFGRPIMYMDETGATNLDELRERISGSFLRRKKKEVLDLPEKIISEMECELSPEWEKNYDSAWDAYLLFLENNPMPEKNIDNIIQARHLVEIQKLKQVCSQAKLERIVADIENAVEQGEKVIVFSQYTKTVENLRAMLKVKKVGTATLTGDNTSDERQQAVDAFQTNEYVKVFIANIKAGGVGLNLTAASIVMFADMDWSPATHNQAMDRAHRIGQEGTVNVYFYVALGTIEEDILQILNDKERTIEAVMEGTEDTVKQGDSVFRQLIGRIGGKLTNRSVGE